MHRFFVPPDCIEGDTVNLPADTSRQLTRVLRARSGDKITVLDNSGLEYIVTLDEISRDSVRGTVEQKVPSRGEPDLKITLYQGVMKSDKFEYVLQKGTELGITNFVPVYCERSIRRASKDESIEKRLNRWRRIIVEAAEQSRRGKIPRLSIPADLSAACDAFEGEGLIPWEEERSRGLKGALSSFKIGDTENQSVGIFIGPEGGFTADEIQMAASKGIISITLGNRILRAETAGIVTAAAIFYEFGELG